jgi:light-independent protochlorophyllide reductase subunit B
MQLTLWTYEGPPHVGAMRIATAMKDVHYVLHAPQGDTYADLLFTMIERLPRQAPAGHLHHLPGARPGRRHRRAVQDRRARGLRALRAAGDAGRRLLHRGTDPGRPGRPGRALNLPVPVVALELPAYQRKENWGAAETFYQLVRALAGPPRCPARARRARAPAGQRPRCNLLGPTALGFRHRDDVREITPPAGALGIDVNVVAPLGATPADLAACRGRLQRGALPRDRRTTAQWLQRSFGQPFTSTVPIGVGATRDFIAEVAALAGVDPAPRWPIARVAHALVRALGRLHLPHRQARLRLRRCHACVAAARVATASWASAWWASAPTAASSRARCARPPSSTASSADHRRLPGGGGAASPTLQPELVLGTQMERHIAKRLGMPCAVISAPVHVQDFPARYSPQMGFEGANVLFDTWVHPLMMGLEEHLLGMFRDDFEFHDGRRAVAPGRRRHRRPPPRRSPPPRAAPPTNVDAAPALRWKSAAPPAAPTAGVPPPSWAPDAERELRRSRSSCAARRAATPSASPADTGVPHHHHRDPLRCQSLLQPLSPRPAGHARGGHRHDGQPPGQRGGARPRVLARKLPGLRSACTPPPTGATSRGAGPLPADIARGDIVVATMLFMEDHFLPVLPALQARREHCDAMVCAMSASEVMRSPAWASFDMDGPVSGPWRC